MRVVRKILKKKNDEYLVYQILKYFIKDNNENSYVRTNRSLGHNRHPIESRYGYKYLRESYIC